MTIGRALAISYLLFVDNVLTFCFREEGKIRLMMKFLQLFYEGTSIEVHFNNVVIYSLNINGVLVNQLRNIFPFDRLDLNDGLKYLGFRLKPNGYGKQEWS